MEFGTVIQKLEEQQKKSAYDFTIDDMLGIVVDLFNAADRSMKEAKAPGVQKLEDIKVGDENRFVRNLCRLAMSFGRIYRNNATLFSEDSMTADIQRAADTLIEVYEKTHVVDEQAKEAETKQQELRQANENLQEKLQQYQSLIQQNEQLESLKCTYEDKLEESQHIQEHIDDYQTQRIPELENEIAGYRNLRDELERQYTQLETGYEAERHALVAEKARVQSLHDQVEKEHTAIRQTTEQIEKQREQMLAEIETYKQQSETEQEAIENSKEQKHLYETQIEYIKAEQERRQTEIAEQKKRLEDAKIELYIYKINLERLIRNYQIQQQFLDQKQMQIAAQIKALLDDDVLNGSWMYSIDDLRTALNTKRETMNRQIQQEMKLFADVLRKLETDNMNGGYYE